MEIIENLVSKIEEINKKIDYLVSLNKQLKEQAIFSNKNQGFQIDTMTLLSLPMSLRQTIMALYKLEKGTAKDIAKITNRLRAVESASANQLVRLGYLKKQREGRDVYFYIKSEEWS